MTIQQWLSEYAESHQHPTNKKVHFVCVPIIFFTIVGFLYSVKLPMITCCNITLAHIALLIVAIYYVKLSPPLSVGMILFSILCLLGCGFLESHLPIHLALFCLIVFVLAWIGQFWGHGIEGKKPSFFKDLQFLMIGPAWIMTFIYNKIGIKI